MRKNQTTETGRLLSEYAVMEQEKGRKQKNKTKQKEETELH